MLDFRPALGAMICFLMLGCASMKPAQPLYPQDWWAPADKASAPQWEVLPQDAKAGEVILSKRNDLGLLSNFAATPFTYRGKTYASVEGFWQSLLYPEDDHDPRAKYPGVRWMHKRSEVAKMTGFEAKNAGKLAKENMKFMKIDWVTFEGKKMTYKPTEPSDHYNLIVAVMWEKLKQNKNVRDVLMSTGTLKLKPDHLQEDDPPAAWKYYDIWMDIRAQLQKQENMPHRI